MLKQGVRYWVLGVREILFSLFFLLFILYPSSFIRAQHTRLYACALASNDPAAFMGGSSIGAGLWQSDDTGKTWKQLGWKHVKCYSVDVTNNGKIIYEACGNGVLKSTDEGITWKMITDWRITEVLDIAIDQKKPDNIYIATAGAIWKSDDAGNNWYEADTDIPYPIFSSRIVIDPMNNNKIYTAVENAMYESNDAGLEWKKVNTIHETVDIFNKSDLRKIVGEPKNVHSHVSIGNNFIIGSLDGGVWKSVYSDSELPVKIGLENLQIWRLKAIEIK